MATMRFFLVAMSAMTLVQLALGQHGHGNEYDGGDAITHHRGKPEKTIKPHATQAHGLKTDDTIPTETQFRSRFENIGEHAGSYEPAVVGMSSRDDEVEWPSDWAGSLADDSDDIAVPVSGSERASGTDDVDFENEEEREEKEAAEVDEDVVDGSRALDWLDELPLKPVEDDEDDSSSGSGSPGTQAPTKSSAHHHQFALSGCALVATAVVVVAYV